MSDTEKNTTGIQAGSRVLLTKHPSYLKATQRVFFGRLGTVEKVFTPMGAQEPLARIIFDARRKGSKTITETFRVDALELANVG